MTTYRLIIQIPSQHLATILQVIEGTAKVEKIDVIETSQAVTHHQKNFRFANGTRNKGISAENAAMECIRLSNIPATTKAVGEYMATKWGFAATTSSPTLFNLRKQGTVTRLADGRYVMADSAAIERME
jgi:hypothetical protein